MRVRAPFPLAPTRPIAIGQASIIHWHAGRASLQATVAVLRTRKQEPLPACTGPPVAAVTATRGWFSWIDGDFAFY